MDSESLRRSSLPSATSWSAPRANRQAKLEPPERCSTIVARSSLVRAARAYGMEPASFDAVLALVGPGTQGGELLRRYWQPVALSSEATNLPRQIRRLGEELILFRNDRG